jgi:hypothetical protein
VPSFTTTRDFDFPILQGRWISPDPSGVAAVDPLNPQTWNRYGYVGNNPLSHIDVFGLSYTVVCWNDDSGWSYFEDDAWHPIYELNCGTANGGGGGGIGPQLPPSGALMPTKGFCSFTANVQQASQATQDAIQQIYNQAGVGIDFVTGSADLTVQNKHLGQDVYGNDNGGSNAVVDMNQIGNYPAALGVLISHEWGHFVLGCQHWPGTPDCGDRGLMGPGNAPGHGPPGFFMIPQNSSYQFLPGPQSDAVKQKCISIHGQPPGN